MKSMIIIPAEIFDGKPQTEWESLWAEWMPLGPLSIATNTSHDTVVIDEAVTPDYIDYNNISKDIKDIGFYCTIGNFRKVVERSKSVRDLAPWVRISWGGPFCHVKWKKMIERPEVDWICYGYGEETWERVLNEGLNEDIPNLVYRENGKVVITPMKVRDLRILKKPNFDLLPDYEIRNKNFIEKGPYGVGIPGVDYEGWQLISMISADGCPVGPQARCSFCTRGEEAYIVYGAELYAKNIKEYIEKYGKIIISEICDDFMNMGFLKTLDIELTKQNVPRDKFNIDFCFGSAYLLSTKSEKQKQEYMRLLKSLNIRRVFVGYEHRTPELLNIVKLGLTQEQQDITTDLLIEAGIEIDAAFILGVPGETKETLKEVYEFAKELKRKSKNINIRPHILILIPPSGLWIEAIKNSDFNNKFGDTDIMDICVLNNEAINLFYNDGKPEEITGENAIDKVYQAQWYMKHLNDENPPFWY